MKYRERLIDGILEKNLDSPLITVVTGPRQVGKTTTISRILSKISENRVLILNMDFSRTIKEIRNDEQWFEKQIAALTGIRIEDLKDKVYIFIDEAQKYPEIFPIIKILHDTYKGKVKIILSGSSDLEIKQKTAETLAGRTLTYHMHPFSISEVICRDSGERGSTVLSILDGDLSFGSLKELELDRCADWKGEFPKIEEYAVQCLLPPVYSDVAPDEVNNWILSYIDSYIERDMRSLHEIGNIESYREVVIQFCQRIGSHLSFSSLARDAGINWLTCKKYISYLKQSLMAYSLKPFFINISKRVKKSPKMYMADNGISRALSDFPSVEILKASGKIGNYFENLILNEFRKWNSVRTTPAQFYFWESTAVSQVDLIIETEGKTIPVEIKYGNSFKTEYIRGIETFKDSYSEKGLEIPFSLVVYNGPLTQVKPDIIAMPFWLLI